MLIKIMKMVNTIQNKKMKVMEHVFMERLDRMKTLKYSMRRRRQKLK